MRNNIYNKIFHKKELKKYLDKKEQARKVLEFKDYVFHELKTAHTLMDLILVHKKAWKLGFQNENIGPCPYGMFRADSIESMLPEEVYLGGIYGLNTKNLNYWTDHYQETMAGNGFGIPNDTRIYDIVLEQYRGHLLSNFRAIVEGCSNFILHRK